MTGPEASSDGGPPQGAPRSWPVFATYLLAFVGIVALNLLALALLHEFYPGLPEREITLPALLAGGLASSTALMLALVATVRPLDARRIRLVPGRETGPMLALIIVGTLALGQALDSATAIAGLANRGAIVEIRRALEGATGADLFAAVLVIGPIAGTAEEIFFRGFMQTALGAVWRPAIAVAVTAAAFALLHVEPIHATQALALGLWFGAVTAGTGSALPAVAAHVVNNVVFTVLTALSVTIEGIGPNLAVGASSVVAFVGVAIALRHHR
ncbi:MAG TPA: CPBP family intramembrane glutamic endopeptidase [Methylomirabilota bacterium]|nr:CPBP family intramembrane glutamic endopeptidase [Methylomirabilota bacterium]